MGNLIMGYFSGWLSWCNDLLSRFAWGPVTLFLLALSGFLFSFGTGFFQLRHIRLWWRSTFGSAFRGKSQKTGGITGFQSACTALAATLGTGNIAGVATAIAAGGPGAVFWMWISAFFGTMTGYAENLLAGLYRGKNAKGEPIGGAMFYIEQGLGCRWLALLFSFFCILGSLGMGDMAQANSIATGLQDAFGVPPLLTGLAVAGAVGFAMLGGIQRMGQITERLVPFMAIGYTAAAVCVILANWRQVPMVLNSILQQAFNLQAGLGGLAGYGMKQALQVGVARGVSSNEAGLGSSVMANSAAGSPPVVQGMWGVFEVAVDTLLMCTLTALAILCSGVYDPARYAAALGTNAFSALPNGAALTADAFRSVFGPGGGALIAVSLMLFAFSTLLGWSYYGERAVEYLFGPGALVPYKLLYLSCIVIGCVTRLDLVWQISDTFNGLMVLPNLLAVLWLSPQVFRETRRFFHAKGTSCCTKEATV
ncbi:sodium:alanine symporter family protein [Gemmiger sp. An194]|uniref:alanine/glycine:cation symporter family protein n=1 Tax=Gemmiger sp. An194 TaxID=1965582 RepID=UPI001FFDE4B1|nr:sodium:alanine symporter family protein [Gemmiger sp. An194]